MTRDQQIKALEKDWAENPRWLDVKRGYGAADVVRLDRHVRIRPAEPVPDLVASVTARVRPAQLGRGGWMRPALAWVAVIMLVQSVPMLLFGDAGGIDAHYARHLGAFGAASARSGRA